MATGSTGARKSGGEQKMAVLIGVVTALLLLGAWLVTRMTKSEDVSRPVPVWLGISPVTAQTADGRILQVKVNLQVKDDDDLALLAPYEPVFKSIVFETGSALRSSDARGGERIEQFGDTVLESVNDYLGEQRVQPRVKRVAFEEFKLMP